MRTCGTDSTAWCATSWTHTHSRRSSFGKLHSRPNSSRFGTTTISSSLGGRGIGRSYWPNDRRARWPSIDPAVMPSIIGPSICIRPPNIAAIGSPSPSSSLIGSTCRPDANEPASASNRSRSAPMLRSVHWVRLTGTMVMPVPVGETTSPLALATWSSATRASCSSWIRATGSTFGSGCPSLAIDAASWRAASHDTGPCCCCWNMRARSPRNGTPLKGSSPGPTGPSAATRGMVGR